MAANNQSEEGIRKIYLTANAGEQSDGERQVFKSNHVSTTKYEWYDMVPKNLLEQFQRVANFWFLTVSIFQMLPFKISPTSEYATIMPLCCVIFVTFCKDAWEDQVRRRDDFRMNNQPATVVEDPRNGPYLRQIKWKEVQVGNYIQVERDQPIPADMILLSSSNEEDGTAFVDTAQLDGETSLKPKFPLEETMRLGIVDISTLNGHIASEQPNELVQSFNGTLWLSGHPRGLPIEAKNFLLRGSTLRNTQWIYGVVVFTGVDTKLVMNSKRTPSKRSHVEKLANRLLLIVFAVLLVMALAATSARAVWIVAGDTGRLRMDWVWPEKDPIQDNKYLALFTFLIGYNNLIPISLYVTTDLVRTFQGMLMESDPSMYHPQTESGCRVRNSGLCENLGQVEFVLSDKTGTLTENKMSFKACCIGSRVYGRWDQTVQSPVAHVVQMPPSDICVPLDPNLWIANRAPRRSERSDTEKIEVDDFFLCLASCHTAIVEDLPPAQQGKTGKGTSQPGSLAEAMQNAGALQVPGSVDQRRNSGSRAASPNGSPSESLSSQRPDPELIAEAMMKCFRSSSPDEEALILAARDHGYFFRKKMASKITINIRGQDFLYTVLAINEFTSERKRMSVLVQRADFDQLTEEQRKDYVEPPAMLFVKGADNVMLERLTKGRETDMEAVKSQLKKFSSCGLRCLVLAKRQVSAKDANTMVAKMIEAKNALMNRNQLCDEVANDMEKHLQYVGITAIEDKIQQGVPKTIEMLLRAGIKVWMLTGDNMETAINIGIACRLTNPEMRRFMLDAPSSTDEMSPRHIENQLEGMYKEIKQRLQEDEPFQYCVVVHGSMMYTIEDHDRLRQLFLAIACSSTSVIACRLAPAQKAALVKLVRSGLEGNPLTLAIGDGGNDVSMIQEAHVGVGLLGVEGRQAANAADFTISQFRFLQPLLLVHGHWNLRRIGIVIAYSFYKNFILVLPMVGFSFDTGFTGTTLYDSYLLTIFNLIFTSLPILIMGVFDCDVSAKMALLTPSLYQLGINRCYFNRRMLIGWISRGMLHSMFIFLAMRLLFGGAMAMPSGDVPDYLVMGSWGYWVCVWVVNLILLLHTKAWMDWYVVVSILSALFFVPTLLLYSQGDYAAYLNEEMTGVGMVLFARPGSWLGLVLVVSSCGLFDLAILFTRKVASPNASDILQEVQLGYLSGGDSAGLLSKYEPCRELPVETKSSTKVHPSDGNAPASSSTSSNYQASPSGDTDDYIDNSFGEDSPDDAGASGSDETQMVSKTSLTFVKRRRSNEVKDVLQRLPCPTPRVHKVKPLGNLYLEPLAARKAAGRQFGLNAVVPDEGSPVPGTGNFGIVSAQASSPTIKFSQWKSGSKSSTGSLACNPSNSASTVHSATSFYIREPSWSGRFWNSLKLLYRGTLQKQWCEMTVGDQLLVGPKHFKSPSRDHHSSFRSMSQRMPSIPTIHTPNQELSMSHRRSRDSDSEAVLQGGGESPFFTPTPSGASVDSTTPQSSGSFSGTGMICSHSTNSTNTAGSSVCNVEFLANDNATSALSTDNAGRDASNVRKELIYSVVTLRFLSSAQETSFGKYFSDHAVQMFQKSIMCFSAAIVLYNLYENFAYGWKLRYVLLGVASLPAGCIMIWFLSLGFVARNAEKCILSFILLVVCVKHFYDIFTSSYGVLANSYLPVFIMAGVRIRIPGIGIVLGFHLFALSAQYWWGSQWIEVDSRLSVVTADGGGLWAEYFVLMLGITLLCFYHAYLIEKLMRQDFIVLYSLKHSKYQAMEILKSMFPEEVVNHVIRDIQRNKEAKETASALVEKQGSGAQNSEVSLQFLREDCGTVSVLFCDVMHFDNLVENLKPTELVGLLDSVWMIFDRLVQHNNLTKIETVGKTYMAAAMGGEDDQVQAGAANAVVTAIAMLDMVEKRVLGVGAITNVSVRIGIHTGPTMCGVVGSRKPQFALFGDTVNTAARMQSNGKENHVHVSGATHNLISDDGRFTWIEREIPVKGKGTMKTYLLNRENGKRCDGGRRLSNVSHSSKNLNGSSEDAMSPKVSMDLTPSSGFRRLSSGMPGPSMRRNSSGSNRIPVGKRSSLSYADADGNVQMATSRSEPLSSEGIHPPDDEVPGGPAGGVRQSMATLATACSSVTVQSAHSRSTALNLASPFKSGKNLFRYLNGGASDRAQREKIFNVQDMRSIWMSFQLFLVCYAAESFCLLLGGRRGGLSTNSSDTVLMAFVRLGYLVLGLTGSVLLHRLGSGLEWRSPSPRPNGIGIGSLADHFTDIVAIIIFLGFLSSTVSNVGGAHGSEFWNVFEALFFMMVLMHMYRTNLQGIVLIILCALVIVIAVVVTGILENWGPLVWECVVYSLLMTGVQIMAVNGDPRKNRHEHKAICEEHDRLTQLLDSMLPREVLIEMKAGNLRTAYNYDNMTFLFADIVGFTSYCASHKAEEAVNLVTRLFAEFDESTEELQIYKVCTIGDAYVVVNEPRTKIENQYNDAERVYRLAERMINIIIRVRTQVDHDSLDMRIGLHCGSFVGGVIGTTRVRFDVWGEDVLLGNMVESEGAAGQVCASAEAKQVLEKCPASPHLSFKFHRTFELKYSKREVQSYVIENTEGIELM